MQVRFRDPLQGASIFTQSLSNLGVVLYSVRPIMKPREAAVCVPRPLPLSLEPRDADRQFFKSQLGLPAPYDSVRQTHLTHSFCQHVVTSEDILLVKDAKTDPRVRDNLAVKHLNVIAYVGVLLRMPDGSVLGSFCAIERGPRLDT